MKFGFRRTARKPAAAASVAYLEEPDLTYRPRAGKWKASDRTERAIPSGISGRLFRRNEFPFDSVRCFRFLRAGRSKQES